MVVESRISARGNERFLIDVRARDEGHKASARDSSQNAVSSSDIKYSRWALASTERIDRSRTKTRCGMRAISKCMTGNLLKEEFRRSLFKRHVAGFIDIDLGTDLNHAVISKAAVDVGYSGKRGETDNL